MTAIVSQTRYPGWKTTLLCCLATVMLGNIESWGEDAPKGWQPQSPREAIRPGFAYQKSAGRQGEGALVIEHDQREGLDGWWEKTFDVEPGTFVRFQAFRQVQNTPLARRSAVVRILWRDDKGKSIKHDGPLALSFLKKTWVGQAQPEHPVDQSTDQDGWTEVAGTYRVPAKATKAKIELHLMWAPNGRVTWSQVTLQKTETPKPRTVRLATVHFRPRNGKTPADNCQQFAPFLEQAAEKNADLVVLPETVNYCGLSPLKPIDVAEPVPGPSTEFYGDLAKKHNYYVVVGLYEKVEHLVYNVAVLIGPDGKIIGKYRKVTLPRNEIANGVAPGEEYPVFDTRFGKVGMMVCYDGFHPEVARRLTNNGAEIIAFPVWGCNPQLAKARAIENQIYVVSSTYTSHDQGWMISAIYDRAGNALATATDWGSVAVAEVDLGQPTHWLSLGNYKDHLFRHRPLSITDKKSREH